MGSWRSHEKCGLVKNDKIKELQVEFTKDNTFLTVRRNTSATTLITGDSTVYDLFVLGLQQTVTYRLLR